MSKSYFERRIFGQSDQTEESQDQAPSLGALKAETNQAPSQPYRFRAARQADLPPISAAHITDPDRVPAPHGWEASPELQDRLGLTAEPETVEEQPALQPEAYEAYLAEQEQLMDDLTGHRSEPHESATAALAGNRPEEPYPLSAPQPPIMTEEPSFGFHGGAEPAASSYETAPIATTATHAVSQTAAPASAVTEPRLASASAVGFGDRVNLSDQRVGSSVQPNLYVSADDRISGGAAAASASVSSAASRGPKPPQRNPLAAAAAGGRGPKSRASQPALSRKPMQAGTGAMPPRRPRRRDEGGVLGFMRKGAIAVAALFGIGLLMSVSYAALQGLRSTSTPSDIPVLLAPPTPVKLTPEEAGIDPNTAAGRTFEADLLVLSSPQGVLEPSDNRYAASADATPPITMDFGGQSVILPQIDTAQPAVLIDPMQELAVAPDPAVNAGAVEPEAVIPEIVEPTPTVEEPLADLKPLANGLNDIAIPKARGSVPSGYEGLIVKVQAQQTTPSLAPSGSSDGQIALVQSDSTATINPAAGLPTVPTAPGLTGAAVVAPFGIQLASLRTEQQAKVLWKRLQDKHPELLGGLSYRVVQYDSGARGIFYRLQAGPMPNKTTAVDYCVRLKRAGQECFFVRG